MTSDSYAAKQLTKENTLLSARTEVCDRPDSLWQCMFHSWLHTYKLSASSGAVPFLLI